MVINQPLKRLERAPRVYVRDSGLLHALLDVASLEKLRAHDKIYGFSWEGYCIEQLLTATTAPAFFYRANNQEEIDLVLDVAPDRRIAIEFKVSKESVKSGFHSAIADIKATEAYLVTQAPESYDKSGYRVTTLPDLIQTLLELRTG